MDDKPIWNQNDPLNARTQHPNELIMIFIMIIYSHETQETDFVKWNKVEE